MPIRRTAVHSQKKATTYTASPPGKPCKLLPLFVQQPWKAAVCCLGCRQQEKAQDRASWGRCGPGHECMGCSVMERRDLLHSLDLRSHGLDEEGVLLRLEGDTILGHGPGTPTVDTTKTHLAVGDVERGVGTLLEVAGV